ncbi:sulfite exporter TauE/SafE family protein [Palleronia aestuarii]|uniref:sulfite exporter TauE/SafE family protein n=1 Tax=Palleronia aestuarii TaxID=568105 RepID=UPI001F19230F|nr:sulfite exporter TauE/SafE family protein [Palleronia aestuarii]
MLLVVAAVVVGMSKGGLATAAAIAVPMLSLVMNPIAAAATLLPVYLVTDWVGVWFYRRNFSRRNLVILVPAMIFGIVIATIVTPYTPEPVLLVVTGLIGIWFCARTWLRRTPPEPAEAAILPGLFWGTITGITSFITHSGAPPSQAYLLPQRLPKLEFAGTIAIAFAIGNLAKLPGYWVTGALVGLEWRLTAILIVAGVCGTILGRWIVELLPDATYMQVIKVMLFTLSAGLIAKALTL